MLFFVQQGYRIIGIDRRGHGRSSQVSDGHDMDHYAADAAAVVEHLDLRNAIHVGHSTGGGEVTRYVARHGNGRVAKAVLMSAVPPIMVKTTSNPGGLSIEVFDGLRKSLAANRPILRIQSTRRGTVGGCDRKLVAPRHAWRGQGPLRWHQGFF
jgi:non-heme chloroperoxidase